MSDTRFFSVILLLAAGAVAIGAAHLLQMIVRDIVERAREDEAADSGWFD